MEKSEAGMKKNKSRRPINLNQNIIIINNIVVFYTICKKYNEIQLTKNKMYLNNRKMTNHPPSTANNTIRLPNNTRDALLGCTDVRVVKSDDSGRRAI